MTREAQWTQFFRSYLTNQAESDPAHDLQHIERVVLNVRHLARIERVTLEALLPAAYLHDCVHVPKNSTQRSQASRLSADHAIELLRSNDYPKEHFKIIHHSIEAHSFSANIIPRTIEAKVLQDADRIDALGAVGLSRCLMLGGYMGSDLYHPEDPFVKERNTNDAKYCIDHFYAKLLGLKETMQTEAGKILARERTQVLTDFLKQLGTEIGRNP